MIVAVDDEFATLALIQETLEGDGHSVQTFTDAHDALGYLAEHAAELILSDVMMPAMGGFDFRTAFAQRFPNRATPFVFLSSLSDPSAVVKGLDIGADDYLTKPVDPAVLRAKVRAHLRRSQREAHPAFRGDIERFPFVKVMQFCEAKGLTGHVEIQGGSLHSTVRFRAGEIAVDEAGGDDGIEALFDLTEGRFTIYSEPISFAEIGYAAAARPTQPAESVERPAETVMGRLSGIALQDRLLQIQTELVTHPNTEVVTIVINEGRTILKHCSGALQSQDRSALEALVAKQHQDVEQQVRDKLAKLSGRTNESADDAGAQYERLFEQGLAKYLQRDFPAALEAWQQAQQLDPDNKVLQINLTVVRKKLAESEC